MPITNLNGHGQPLAPYNAHRVLARVHSEMIGLIRGLLADQRLTDEEILAFRNWLRASPDAVVVWPGKQLADRVVRVLADGIITEDERADLIALMQDVTGQVVDAPEGSGRLAVSTSTRAAFTTPAPTILFDSKRFVLTGQFVTGTRSFCESQVVALGGICQSAPTRETDFVVVGAIGSEQWAESAYGRKIERAVELREKGYAIAIVPEEDWAIALSM